MRIILDNYSRSTGFTDEELNSKFDSILEINLGYETTSSEKCEEIDESSSSRYDSFIRKEEEKKAKKLSFGNLKRKEKITPPTIVVEQLTAPEQDHQPTPELIKEGFEIFSQSAKKVTKPILILLTFMLF